MKQQRFFLDYISYDFDEDKAWIAFMEANPEIMKEPRDKEEAKREFYKAHINSRFDTNFTIADEEERDRFIHFVKYNNTLRCLTAIHEKQSGAARTVCNVKHICFVGFMLCFPLKNWQPAAICYASAHILSIIHMYMTLRPKKDPFTPRLFSEEELLTVFAYIAILISGPFVRILLYTQLLIWAFLSTCEWIEATLEQSPNFPVLCALAPLITNVKDIWIDIIKLKNHIEVFTMMFSCIGWLFGLNAPLLPVVYSQFVRIKAISSHFTKNSFSQLRNSLEQNLPEGIYLAFVEPAVRYIGNMGSEQEKEEEKNDGKDKDEANSNLDQKSKPQTKPKKSRKLRPVESDSDDEPKTYEIVDDKLTIPEATPEDLD